MSSLVPRLSFALLASLSMAAGVCAQEAPSAPASTAAQPKFFHDLALDLKAAKSVPGDMTSRRWRNLGLGLLAIAATAPFDERIREAYQRTATPGNEQFARTVRPLGEAGGIALVGLGWGIGKLSHNVGLVSTANDSFEATLLAAGVIAPVLKEVVGRARPMAELGSHSFSPFSGNASFPSGEVTEAFAIASVVSAHYHSPWVRIAAWGTAAAIANGRLRLDAHWASDVVAGGLLGSGIGTWVVHEHRRRAAQASTGPVDGEPGRPRLEWMISPSLSGLSSKGRQRAGLMLTLSW